MNKFFINKVALITGAGSGIGLDTAKILASYGASLILVSKSNSAINLHKKLSKKYNNIKIISFSSDITIEENVKNLVKKSLIEFKKIDILINSAGKTSFEPIEDTSLESWNDIHNQNGTTVFLLCKYVLPIMKKNNFGKIVNVSSIAGRFRGMTSGLSYAYSKSGLLAFTKQLAFQVGKYNINVNVFCPSQTMTPMLKKLIAENYTKQKLKEVQAKIPLGRIATSIEQANVIVFLSSDKSSYITGSFIDSNGGLY